MRETFETRMPLGVRAGEVAECIARGPRALIQMRETFEMRMPLGVRAGEVAEWLKAHAWNACIGETLSRVRIPLSPPLQSLSGH